MTAEVKAGGDPLIHAHAAVKDARFLDAARWFLEAQHPYDAAVCFQKANQLKDCFDALLKVSSASPPYRLAALHATRIAITLNEPPERLFAFVGPFVSGPPASPAEAAAYKQIG